MKAIDTSVAVAALAAWHEAHGVSRKAASGAAIAAHARLETYSVLTRMPAPHRFGPDVAAELIRGWFPGAHTLVPSQKLSRSLVERCFAAGVDGGAVYDALVGLTASEAGCVLLTRDARACRTYERVGALFDFVG